MPMNHHEYETNVAEMALTGEGVMGPPGEKRHSVSHSFSYKIDDLPRQARDKHRENYSNRHALHTAYTTHALRWRESGATLIGGG